MIQYNRMIIFGRTSCVRSEDGGNDDSDSIAFCLVWGTLFERKFSDSSWNRSFCMSFGNPGRLHNCFGKKIEICKKRERENGGTG